MIGAVALATTPTATRRGAVGWGRVEITDVSETQTVTGFPRSFAQSLLSSYHRTVRLRPSSIETLGCQSSSRRARSMLAQVA